MQKEASKLSNFVTCDLLDNHPECQVFLPNIEGKRFYNYGGHKSFFGQIVTVKCFEDNSVVKELLNANGKDENNQGKILVVDGGGSMRCALLGDMITSAAIDNGWAGIVVYGCVRDVDIILNMPIGIMALGSIPRKSTRRGEGQKDLEINLGNIVIRPGMYLYADNNGIIVSKTSLI